MPEIEPRPVPEIEGASRMRSAMQVGWEVRSLFIYLKLSRAWCTDTGIDADAEAKAIDSSSSSNSSTGTEISAM